MKTKKIYWKKAIVLLNNNKELNDRIIDFKDELIPFDQVIIFTKNGIKVPEGLIAYNDDNIDCSDIPEITQEDINSGKLIRVYPAHIKIDGNTADWLKQSNIDYNQLLSNLLKSFYQSVNTLPKNTF